jgi:hypothetical protein
MNKVNLDIQYRGKSKSLKGEAKKLLNNRQAIEPVIVQLKADQGLKRFHLKDSQAIVCFLCCALLA